MLTVGRRATTPSAWIRCHHPANRSSARRVGIKIADNHREYPHTIVNTGSGIGVRLWPNPTGTVIGGNHKSHCAISPAS